jgi:hypothetical protein
MTLALNKIILLLIILFLLFGISAVYGGYLLILNHPAVPLSISDLPDRYRLLLGFLVVLMLGILPILAALQLMVKHKKKTSGSGQTSH